MDNTMIANLPMFAVLGGLVTLFVVGLVAMLDAGSPTKRTRKRRTE